MKISDLDEGFYHRRRPDAYERDYQSSIAGMGGGRRREVDDEANLMYRFNTETGKLNQKMVDVRDEREAKAMGWRYEWKDALRAANIIQSKFDPNKFVQKQGDKWVPVNIFRDKKESLAETGTGGGTTSDMVNVGATYKNVPPKQPKNKDGTAKNALDMKDTNLITGGSIGKQSFIKR